ncbi:hypothetical protein RWA02_29080 (plasmid) [Sinorhizobium meliloti]|uniref:hypothetical protein n=1 Tax=Rhizobium meliloti TaxID=382 RepID=UPI00047F062F|nr:hypothetical protein [Sinorhizobium meliloti]MDW9624409.1 hypothetical protein [Sinorhizobium meliloti]MDW9894814.1 hypothetical protein [Sinorhizobium meliloti]MDW9994883.1 hypothetical protein [Sinorhizobium meliloti]
MKRKLAESEPGYLRDRREAVARPAANVLAGLLLSAASILCAAMIVPAADVIEETCTAQTASVEKQAPCLKLAPAQVYGAQSSLQHTS